MMKGSPVNSFPWEALWHGYKTSSHPSPLGCWPLEAWTSLTELPVVIEEIRVLTEDVLTWYFGTCGHDPWPLEAK